jgi:type III secretion protein L
VSKKFFSLINGKGIHVKPNVKVIPGSEIQTLVEAKEVLEEVQKEAEQYRIAVATDSEQLKEIAQKEGFEAGFQAWTEQIAKLEDEIKKVRTDMEKFIVPVAIAAAKKIVGQLLETSENTIVDIVANTLKSVAQHKKVTIYVNKKHLDAMEASRPRLKQLFEDLESLSIRERADIEPGSCVIETEAGIINAQLDNQWLILENAFNNRLKQKS